MCVFIAFKKKLLLDILNLLIETITGMEHLRYKKKAEDFYKEKIQLWGEKSK